MVLKKKKVHMWMGANFFDKVFEPSRRDLEKQLGTKVTQVDFTEMLYKSGTKLNVKLKKKVKNVKKKKG